MATITGNYFMITRCHKNDFYPEDGGKRFLWNTGNYLLNDVFIINEVNDVWPTLNAVKIEGPSVRFML